MQGFQKYKPEAALEFSTSDEASELTLYLQRQLEDDIARIFDESIYPDLELVCGKLKVLTHACILKTRSNIFFHKLKKILKVNVDRNTFDEIYSFISDSYTECDINRQEREIINYLEHNFNGLWSTIEPAEDDELFLTPKCVSPYKKKKNEKSLSSSPSIELTKEYYALVAIEGNSLEKELIEQDVLSNAFQTIIRSQKDNLKSYPKPSTLSLTSSNYNSCDALNKLSFKQTSKQNKESNVVNQIKNDTPDLLKKNICEASRIKEANISPDSLITDDPSSSSDYLSAANVSPGFLISQSDCQANVCTIKMENTFNSSDSGLENTGMQESLNSHIDATLIDISLTESTLHESNGSSLSQYTDNESSHQRNTERLSATSTDHLGADASTNNPHTRQKDFKTSKEEKQKHNEEIVILESSSLSSETGSWESVFPPKHVECEAQKSTASIVKQNSNDSEKHEVESGGLQNNISASLVQKSPFKSTSCFIDAASLADEEDEKIIIHANVNVTSIQEKPDTLQLEPSQPVPCSSVKHTISPPDQSDCIDNDDSLEQTDNKDPESLHKDLSPTIFEMTPITEDSICSNTFETADKEEQEKELIDSKHNQSTTVLPYTPYNSIMSVRSSTKQYESESDVEARASEIAHSINLSVEKNRKKSEYQPIVSGGASIEDHLPQVGSYSCSPAMKRKLESTPIVSGAYISEEETSNQRCSPKPDIKSAWVVDMSAEKLQAENDTSHGVLKKPGDKTCENLRRTRKHSSSNENCSKSRSSVDSDSSEKSSHRFYIDLSTLPDLSSSNKNLDENASVKKKNIFSMYIDLGDSPRLKEMPARLSSSLNCKKNTTCENKSAGKLKKSAKNSLSNTNQINESGSTTESRENMYTEPDLIISETANDPAIGSQLSDNSKPDTIKLFGKKTNESELTFETLEVLCSDPNISITDIISDPVISSKILNETELVTVKGSQEKLHENKEKVKDNNVISIISEEIITAKSDDAFVRLSDLYLPAPKSNSLFVAAKDGSTRMTRSIPDENWIENHQKVTSRSIDVISSFHSGNAQSLNRLFPHLKNEFSQSTPCSLSSRTRSPLRLASSSQGDVEDMVSDVSELSSVQSSMCKSVVENSTTEDTSQTSSLISNCQSRLGQDLLRMFLQEIAPDVVVEVSGRRIKAHKCILSSRCQYFAGILSGGWVESSGNVIVLPPFSFNVVHFALCHIYSGVSTIPDSISIVELATIADMLGLEGLKEVIMFTLKAKYCHHFHKPCQVCTAGVLECFPLSSVYGLDDLYRKCLRWITKYFSKVWPTKAFATLPKELLDKCYQQHIVNLNVDNLVDTVCGCGMTVSSLQNSRWADSVARMCRRLVNAAAHYAAPRLLAVLQALEAIPASVPLVARQALDECLAASIDWAPPEEACRAYAFLSETCTRQTPDYSQPDLITNGHPPEFVNSLLYARAATWRLQCEGALVRAALRVVGTQAFKELSPDLRRKLREKGCIMYGTHSLPEPHSPIRHRKNPRAPASNTTYKNINTGSLNMDIVRSSFVPYSTKPVKIVSTDPIKSNNDIRDLNKKVKGHPPKVRMTKAQEERAKFNLLKTNRSQERITTNQNVRISNAKPKYLEPPVSKEPQSQKRPSQVKKMPPKMISSSESSRNSSPILARNMRNSRPKTQGDLLKAPAMSQDSLATSSRPWTAEPSTDSLSESQTSNKYATYTKSKHTVKGSTESVKTLRSQCAPSANNKMKTKIPVSFNQLQKHAPRSSSTNLNKAVAPKNANGNNIPPRGTKLNERKVPATLMSATKSSSAKMVPRITKEVTTNKSRSAKNKNVKKEIETNVPPEIPIMERSGTFLKDEPTFGDKTVDIDH